MTEAGRGRRLVARTVITLLAFAAAPDARATCTSVSGKSLFALNGETCTASGSYAPTAGPALWAEGVGPSPSYTPSNIVSTVPVTITTSSGASYGFYATGGGTITAGGSSAAVSVTTNGANSVAVYAFGLAPAPATSISTITLTDATILTKGLDSPGVLGRSGGSVSLTGGSVETDGNGSAGLLAFFGSVSASGTTITTYGGTDLVGNQSVGVEVAGVGATATLTDDTIMTSGVGSDGVLAEASGKATLDGAMTVTTTNDGAIGLFATGGGSIDGSGATSVAVTTSGTGAIGVYATGAGGSPVTASTIAIGGVATIATNGDSAAGVQADNGGAVTLGGGSVATSGADSPGVVSTGAGSMVTLNGTSLLTVSTITDDSVGLQATSGGVIEATGPVTISTGSTGETPSGANAYGVEANGAGSKVTLAGATTVTTNGTGAYGLDAYGLYAEGGGTIDGSGAPSVAVTTNGDGAIGVYASGTAPSPSTTPSTITLGGVATIMTSGGVATIPIDDTEAYVPAAGVQADLGGQVTLSGGSTTTPNTVTTTGAGAIGLYALSGGTIDVDGPTTVTTSGTTSTAGGLVAYGVNANGLGSTVTFGAATTVTTNGTGANGLNAYGLYANNGGLIDTSGTPTVTVTTNGTNANGIYATGTAPSPSTTPSTITLGGVAAITTNGDSAAGAQADLGGQVTLSGGSTTTPNTVTTTGAGAIGLYALSGGTIDVDGPTTVTTSGTTSTAGGLVAYGVNANGLGSTVTFGAATTVTTNGTGANGLNAYGLYANNGGLIDTSGTPTVTVTTNGTNANGIYATGTAPSPSTTPSTITLGGVAAITTNGDSAAGAQADLGGQVTLSGGSTTTPNTVTTTGAGAIGLYALSGGVITASGPATITTSGTTSTTTGLGAYGVNADGSGSQINLAGATIMTSGAGAVGLYASDVSATGSGGAITVSGLLGVTTSGAPAYGAWAQSAGSTIALNGASTFTINGPAFALFASEGGVITAGGALGATINGGAGAGGVEASGSGSTVTLSGAATIALNGASNTGLFATTGGAITTEAATSITASGASSTGVQATSGTVTATGGLNVTTSQASSVAFALSGTSPSIIASGGGTVSAAGNAINFVNATGAVATFDNFNFTSSSGDLIFADPSTATINFNNTVANASGGNLLNATNKSAIIFNADASTLTGAIQTDSTSTTNVTFTNGTNWTMTGSSTVTNLSLTNSSIVFSPSGGFKTLTVGSLIGGTGANVTLNTALGALTPTTDQIVINGGSATGTTALTIKNASANNAGVATTAAGIPVVVVANGGTTSTTAFQLANNAPIVAGGYEYSLERGGNEDWYLVSSPTATLDAIQNSVNSLFQAQFNQMITTQLLGSLLLGANEQISGCDCGGGFAGVGSFSLGSHGRWALSDSLTLLAGMSFDSFYQDGVNVSASPIVAAALRYDPANWGKSRPFLEFGAALSPYMPATYTRYYANGLTPAEGVGSAIDRGLAIYGRLGWVARVTPIDEAAAFVDLVRGWQEQGGYTEVSTAVNPFPLSIGNGIDREDVVRLGATFTHLFFGNLEANANGAVAHGFDSSFGSQVSVLNFGSIAPFPILNSTWAEFGGRLGYRFSSSLVVDAFAVGTLGGEIGRTLHVGLGARYAF